MAGLEFSKGVDPSLTWSRSLEVIAPYPELVVVGRKMTHMMNEEIRTGKPCRDLVDYESTSRFRELLVRIKDGNEDVMTEMVASENWKPMRTATDHWSMHESHKLLFLELYDIIKNVLHADTLKDLRNHREAAIERWLKSDAGIRCVFELIGLFIRARGVSANVALELAVCLKVVSVFVCGITSLSLHWMASGGVETAKAGAISNDLIDLEYGTLGAMSDCLLTDDQRLRSVHQAIRCWVTFVSC